MTMDDRQSIGQLAKATGVPVKTLRYYSDIGLLVPAEITTAKYRRFHERDAMNVALIRSLRSLGFSLEVIRDVLRQRRSARDTLRFQLEALETQRRSIQRQIAVLHVVNERGTDADVLDQVQLAQAAVSLSLAERDAHIATYISRVAVGTSKQHLGRRFLQEIVLADLPEDLSLAQLEAWIRLYTMMQDTNVQRLVRKTLSPLTAVGRRSMTPVEFFTMTMDIMRALGTHAVASTPGSDPRVLALATAWAKLIGRAAGRRHSKAFMHWLDGYTRAFVEPPVVEFYDAVASLHGWPDVGFPAANRLLLAALAIQAAT
jgi:DNA-binding transcriptional MerR regulator